MFAFKDKKKFFSQMNHDKYFVPYRNILNTRPAAEL
jgi:hypothetical protein